MVVAWLLKWPAYVIIFWSLLTVIGIVIGLILRLAAATH